MENIVPNSSELLHSFLDGELESSYEAPLFSALNNSSELRSEMRDMLAINRAVREDKAAFVPPIASTAAVFGALGMSTSFLVSSGWLSAFWAKLWIPVAAAVLGSAVTWYAVSPSNSQANNPSPEQTQQQVQTITNYLHDTVVVTKEVIRYAKAQGVQEPRVIVKNVYVPVIDESMNKSENEILGITQNSANNANSSVSSSLRTRQTMSDGKPEDLMLNDPTVPVQPAPLVTRQVIASQLSHSQDIANVTLSAVPDVVMPEPFTKKFYGQLRIVSGSSLVDVSVPADNSFGFNNVAIGGLWRFSDNLGIILEVGREPFAMDFRGIVDGTVKHYEANPALLWAALQFQYLLNPISGSGWQPFVQLGGGATNYGPLGKVLVGTYYSPAARLRLMLGGEGSFLYYNVPGQSSFNTTKLGITYGLSYQF